MPPHLDIYVISPARNRETIERFLRAYVDRAASEDRGDEELMMLALDSSGQPSSGDNWDWEPAKSLTHIVDLGLEFPRRAFSVYLNPQDASLTGATLAFDVDNAVIFGVSIDDEGARAENRERAKTVLYEMAQMLGATRGFIGVEEPPPLRGAQERPAILVYSWPIAWLTCNRRLTRNRKYLRVQFGGASLGSATELTSTTACTITVAHIPFGGR